MKKFEITLLDMDYPYAYQEPKYMYFESQKEADEWCRRESFRRDYYTAQEVIE